MQHLSNNSIQKCSICNLLKNYEKIYYCSDCGEKTFICEYYINDSVDYDYYLCKECLSIFKKEKNIHKENEQIHSDEIATRYIEEAKAIIACDNLVLLSEYMKKNT